jgi:hypothetical protein
MFDDWILKQRNLDVAVWLVKSADLKWDTGTSVKPGRVERDQ